MKKYLLFLFWILVQTGSSVFAQFGLDPDAKNKMGVAMDIVASRYVDEIDDDQLVEDLIRNMLKGLDPHSSYIPADQLKEVNEPLRGAFEGIGIQFNILNDTIVVISPISGGPSERVGIQAGDKIIYVEDEKVAGIGITNEGVIKRLRGKKGTQVTVKIKRHGTKELLPFTITRDKIPIFSIDASYMATPEIGYIKINRFAATTIDEFRKALNELKGQGMESLILDLRGNGGGYLNTAIELADEFLDKNKLIVYTEGHSSPRQEAESTARGGFEKGKLVVLIDEGSASASEIVSGAIQDWDRGLIIGRRSFGKGLVQRDFTLPDHSVLRLTIARYYTPTGRCIQKPYDKGIEAYHQEIIDRFNSGEVIHPDSISFPDSLRYQTPNGRIVYGGGGIMPDIYVPLDTSSNSNFYSALIRKGILNQFSLNYVDKHRAELKKEYPALDQFIANFPQEEAYRELLDYAREKGLEPKPEDLERSHHMIATQAKALIARDLWNTSAYFQIINPTSDAYQKAIEVIEKDEFKAMHVEE